MNAIAYVGEQSINLVATFGEFCRFCGRTLLWVHSALQRKYARLLMEQFFEVGTRSLPVVMITGAFVGMVLAAQSVLSFKAAGLEAKLGSIVNVSVVRELGPVLTAMVMAGRVGGSLAAVLGTMRVTEQIDALRAMGSDPVRVLVVPRFLACLLLLPVLTLYADLTGIAGGYLIGVHVYGINAHEFWQNARSVEFFDIFSGLIKSFLFGGVISMVCCFRGFTCRSGAAGVGRACTESFVESVVLILALDFFVGVVLNTVYTVTWGLPPLL